jgi:hypothetical protein
MNYALALILVSGDRMTARKDDASAADQAAIPKIAGLIQTTSGCRQQRVLRLQRRG